VSEQEKNIMEPLSKENQVAKKKYLEELNKIRKFKFIRVDNFLWRYKV
jgi:hypothetical protein